MKIVIYLIVIAVIFFVAVRYIEAKSVFYPDKELIMTPQDAELPYQDITFQAKDGLLLHGWFISGRPENGVLLFLHGNAGNISHRIGKLEMFYELGLNIFIIDYRGYGKSEGRPTEKGIYQDAQAALDYLLEERNISREKVVIYGASLGGAVAVDLAARNNIGALIVDSTFTNACDMAKRIYPFIPLGVFKLGLLKTKLDSLSKIKMIKAPKLFFHSQQDEIVPFTLGRELFDAAGEPKTFVMISGGHNDGHVYDARKFMGAINEFLEGLKIKS